MPETTLEQRVAALEKSMAQLLAQSGPDSRRKDWRRVVGMFADDAVMKQIDEEGRRIREEDRNEAER